MKIPILLISAVSLSFAIQSKNLKNSDQYYFPKKNLYIEIFKKNKEPKYQCDKRNVYGYFKVNAVNRMSIYEKPYSKSKISYFAKKGDFLEVVDVNPYGWAKFKKGGWGKGHLLYPKIVSQKELEQSMNKKISKKNKYEYSRKEHHIPLRYEVAVEKLRIYKSSTSKGRGYPTRFKKGDVVQIDKSTKSGWLHIKGKGWAKGSNLNKSKEW